MGQRKQAQTLYEKVTNGYMAELGNAHPNTLRAKEGLAVLLKQLGDYLPSGSLEQHSQYERSLALYHDVVFGYSGLFGGGHVETGRCKMNLAHLLRHLGRTAATAASGERLTAAARTMYEMVVAQREIELGEGHIDTLNSKEGEPGLATDCLPQPATPSPVEDLEGFGSGSLTLKLLK